MMSDTENKYFQAGWHYFFEGKFYEAHEEWEQIWLHRRGGHRPFFQGLILLAAGFIHYQKRKFRASEVAFQKVSQKMVGIPSNYLGVPVKEVLNLASNMILRLKNKDFNSDFNHIISNVKIS